MKDKPETEPIIVATEVQKWYDNNFHVLRGVNLTVRKMDLKELQQLFFQAMINQDADSIEALEKNIAGAKSLTPEAGLGVYRGSVIGGLTKGLTSMYPVCCRLVGEQFFNATAISYIYRFPSLSPDIGDYGADFADFLAHFPPAAQLPYLSDVARLEWYWEQVFKGEDNKSLDIQALSAVNQGKWNDLIFSLPKNSVLLASPYPIHRIWEMNQPNYEGTEEVSLSEGGVKIFLWRKGYEMRLELPNDEEWELLQAFAAQESFGDICYNLITQSSPIDVPSLLPIFVQRGWLSGFSF